MSVSYFDTQRPHRLAHRGLSMHRSDIDENSEMAFEQAIASGCTHLESDVHATLDGVAVLFHDDDLARVANLPQKISELNYSELSKIRLRNGSQIPTLEKVLMKFPELRLNLDVKSAQAVAPTAEVINRQSAHDRVLVSSFSSKRRKATLALLTSPVATSASMREVILLWLSHKFFGIGSKKIARSLNALQIPMAQGPIKLATKSFVARQRRNGLEIHFWTINDPEIAKQLVSMGASGVVSDRIDLIKF